MVEPTKKQPNSLVGVVPPTATEELIRQLVPPPEFVKARFENYRPDPNFSSQQQAVDKAKQFVTGPQRKLFARTDAIPGIYFDGGFGVGKTHLLASVFHAFSGKKAFGSFLEYTSLVGYLGFSQAVNSFSLASRRLWGLLTMRQPSSSARSAVFHRMDAQPSGLMTEYTEYCNMST